MRTSKWKLFSDLCLLGAILVICWNLYPATKCAFGFDTEGSSDNHMSLFSTAHAREIGPDGRYVPGEDAPLDNYEPAEPDGFVVRFGQCIDRHNPLDKPQPWMIGLLAGLLVFWRLFDFVGKRAASRR